MTELDRSEDGFMRRISWLATALTVSLALTATSRHATAEDLGQAWDIALQVNQQLQSQQALSLAAGLNLRAARSDRLPRVKTFNVNAILTNTPQISTRSFLGGSSVSGGSTLATAAGFPSALSILGPNQTDLPISLTYATVPFYTGGRLLRNIDAAGAQVGAQRSEEFRTALDLKLTVAEAYIEVLRHRRVWKSPRAMSSSSRRSPAMSKTGGRKASRSATKSWRHRCRWLTPGSLRSRRRPRFNRPGRPTTATSAGR